MARDWSRTQRAVRLALPADVSRGRIGTINRMKLPHAALTADQRHDLQMKQSDGKAVKDEIARRLPQSSAAYCISHSLEIAVEPLNSALEQIAFMRRILKLVTFVGIYDELSLHVHML